MKRNKVVVVLLLLAVAASVGYALAAMKSKREMREQVKRVEAAALRAHDFEVALEASSSQLAEALAQTMTLSAEVERLEEMLGTPVETRVVTRTRTNPINVDLQAERDDLRARLTDVLSRERDPEVVVREVERIVQDCSRADLDVRDVRAHVETEAGNTVLVGSAAIWRVFPPPEVQLGEATYMTDATELIVARARDEDRRSALLATVDSEGIAGLLWTRSRRQGRLVYGAGLRYDTDPTRVVVAGRYHQSPLVAGSSDRVAAVGVVGLRW